MCPLCVDIFFVRIDESSLDSFIGRDDFFPRSEYFSAFLESKFSKIQKTAYLKKSKLNFSFSFPSIFSSKIVFFLSLNLLYNCRIYLIYSFFFSSFFHTLPKKKRQYFEKKNAVFLRLWSDHSVLLAQ